MRYKKNIMKKIRNIILMISMLSMMLFTLSACQAKKVPAPANIDLDLTELSSTMVYSEVYNIMSAPEEYIGKTIKMHGIFTQTEYNGTTYYNLVIADATACCQQGIEFILTDASFPDEYPTIGYETTIVGTFETYEEENNYYCRLKDAVWIKE